MKRTAQTFLWSVFAITTFAVPFEVDTSLLFNSSLCGLILMENLRFLFTETCGLSPALFCCSLFTAECSEVGKSGSVHHAFKMTLRLFPWSPSLRSCAFFPGRLTAYCSTACHTVLLFSKYINILVMELPCMISVPSVQHPALPWIVPWKKHNIKSALVGFAKQKMSPRIQRTGNSPDFFFFLWKSFSLSLAEVLMVIKCFFLLEKISQE